MTFYILLIGTYLHYSKSKYFPKKIFSVKKEWPFWLGTILIVLGTALYVRSDGWVSGLLIALFAIPFAVLLIQFFAVLGKRYFYGFVFATHIFLLFDLLN